MAATIIDQLIVELGLDLKNFDTNQKKMVEQLRKLKQGGQDTQKGFDEFGEKVSAAFSKVAAEATALFAVFIGARSVKDFVATNTQFETSLGRTSTALGLSATMLLSWRNLAEKAGGSADEMEGSIRSLGQELSFFQYTNRSNLLPFFRAMGIQLIDLRTHAMKPMQEILLEMADWASRQKPGQANALLAQMGMSPSMINVLIQGREATQKMLDQQAPIVAGIKGQTDAAEALTNAWKNAQQAAAAYGRAVLAFATPAMVKILETITDILNHPEKLAHPGSIPNVSGPLATVRHWAAAIDPTGIVSGAPGGSIYESGVPAAKPTGGKIAATGLPPEAVALLRDIASSESGGRYNALYGKNRSFSDYSKHPNEGQRIVSGPHKGQLTHVAGAYQFEYRTWLDAMKARGLKDFSPTSQDLAAWYIAQRDYKHATKRDLLTDLKSRDPAVLARIARVLSQTWTSLPGGVEQTQSMQRFITSLGSGMTTGAATAVPSASGSTGGTMDLTKTDIHIGQITVVTQAKDAKGIARDIGPAIRQSQTANSSNFGPN